MSGFAELLHSMGFTITGSDWHESKITKHLESLGIQVVYGQKEENITKDIDLVVYTAAVKKTNPEYQAAEKIKSSADGARSYGWAGNEKLFFRHCHCGTHGKTTTTSIASHIFLAANLDPTISVGGILKQSAATSASATPSISLRKLVNTRIVFFTFFPTVE